jgi:scyllo-inositol 2-dehydrogenase (NADP+)
MKAIVVGMGVQGNKRKKFLGKDFIYSVDKFQKADFKKIEEVPLDKYDTVFACVPDNQKLKVADYCIKNKKNILIEKPFLLKKNISFANLQKKAKKNGVICYTAYNHRFEPNILDLKKLIESKKLGKIYHCRIFYGNGTALLVKKSKWRDKKKGVVTDIGSHLFDLCLFWFGNRIKKIQLIESNRFENKSPDHALIKLEIDKTKVQLEMTLCMWKNTFTCDVLGSKGSAHLNSLCKWGPNTFIFRQRKYPSGYPDEKIKKKYSMKDPTWQSENSYFKKLIKKKISNLNNDLIINNIFNKIV